MGMRNSLKIGGISSADYGIYISGTGTHDAPKRAVEKIAIPGRNGLLAMDQGRYENIIVKYPAFAFGKSREEFQEKRDAFRNALASLTGYQRLEDTYRPNEYRMALYSEGFEVEAGAYGRSGKFELAFECKPQRYLKSGEELQTIASGKKLINTTLQEAEPLIEAEGYGTITLNDQEIELVNDTVGYIVLSEGGYFGIDEPLYIDMGLIDSDDDINITNLYARLSWRCVYATPVTSIEFHGYGEEVTPSSAILPDGHGGEIYLSFPSVSLKKDGILTDTFSIYFNFERGASVPLCRYQLEFSSAINAFRIVARISEMPGFVFEGVEAHLELMDCNSTQSILGHPTYIDCEIGEAYKIHNGEYVSLNRYIDLGSHLPKLKPGDNLISYDDTFTDMKIMPRWWKI